MLKLKLLPGLGICIIGTIFAMAINLIFPSVSALLAGIGLGVLVANTIKPRTSWHSGVSFAGRHLLRAGIVLLGLQLSLRQVAGLGLGMIVVVVVIVAVGMVATLLIGRSLGIQVQQSLLIAAGFSICGAAAVAAVDGVMETKEEEVATAIALVVAFGTLMIPLVPLMATGLGLNVHLAGEWAGGSVHEVAQVVAAGGAIGNVNEAVIVKLARVLMLAPVMVGVGLLVRRHPDLQVAEYEKRPPIVPLFVVGFIAMMGLSSTGWLSIPVLAGAKVVQQTLLACAMFALGLGVSVPKLFQTGIRPTILAACSTAVVSATALGGVLLVS